MVVFEDSKMENKLILYPKGIDWIGGEPRKREGDFEVIEYEHEEPLKLEQENFVECIINGKQPVADSKNGIKVLEILEEAQRKLEDSGSSSKQKVVSSEGKKYFVHSTAEVDEGCEIGEGTKIWHYSHVQKGSVIGKNCSLGQNVNVGNNVRIGNNVKIQNNVSVYEGVELENYVFCGPSMVFTNVLNPRCEYPQRGSEHYAKTLVKYGSSIGANATIVCGNTVGRFAFIGAGAVVTKDVPDYALIVGNPGRIVGWMCRCGTKLKFNGEISECVKCGRVYRKKSESSIVCEKEVEISRK
jgi:UDP-2-acetamido-3-amino-2,3-dideoxy-glucuronate N-acetyltransferase